MLLECNCLIFIKVKERGRDMRLVYKDFRSKLNFQSKNPRTKINTQPNSAPNSPSMPRRPSRPYTTASASYRKETSNDIKHLGSAQK